MTKRSVTVSGHRTSVSLEGPFWLALSEIASARTMSVAALIADIDRRRRPGTSLSAALRLFALDWYRRKSIAK